jgi:hypothetical protein
VFCSLKIVAGLAIAVYSEHIKMGNGENNDVVLCKQQALAGSCTKNFMHNICIVGAA